MEWGGHEAFFFTRLLTIEEKRKKRRTLLENGFFSWKKVNMYVRIRIATYVCTLYVLDNFDFACAKKWLMK